MTTTIELQELDILKGSVPPPSPETEQTVEGAHAVVLLSGGQDSATCLAWACKVYGKENVSAIGFEYGQRHAKELQFARRLADLAGVTHQVFGMDVLRRVTAGASALTDESVEIKETDGLPTSFVPGRNILLLSLAASWAYSQGHRTIHLVTGVSQEDYSGYPDCRQETTSSLQQTLNHGLDCDVRIEAPLQFRTKAQTVKLMSQLGHLDWYAWTLTCYEGQDPPCGTCLSCELRAKGFREAGIPDPLLERHGESLSG